MKIKIYPYLFAAIVAMAIAPLGRAQSSGNLNSSTVGPTSTTHGVASPFTTYVSASIQNLTSSTVVYTITLTASGTNSSASFPSGSTIVSGQVTPGSWFTTNNSSVPVSVTPTSSGSASVTVTATATATTGSVSGGTTSSTANTSVE
ncbi:MAG: hypothetical protein ABSE82_14955 [Nitrososphaerales archaeon]